MTVIGYIQLTAAQFLEMGKDPPGARLELVHGEVAVSPSASFDHSDIVFALAGILRPHIKRNSLGRLVGDVDTVFDDANVRRPDLLFYSKNRLRLIGKKFVKGPPDLCIEVLSPSSVAIDREDKFSLYQAHGVAHYWIIDPDAKTLEAYDLKDGKFLLKATGRKTDIMHLRPFPKLGIPLAELWP